LKSQNSHLNLKEDKVKELGSHLAEMLGVDTKVLNQDVKRIVGRLPESFRFQLTEVEFSNLNFNMTPQVRSMVEDIICLS